MVAASKNSSKNAVDANVRETEHVVPAGRESTEELDADAFDPLRDQHDEPDERDDDPGGDASSSRSGPALPVPLIARGSGAAPATFRHGAHPPYAVRWYGITALYGHFRNFIATAIASESVDSRDWMRPERPTKLLARIGEELDAPNPDAPTLTEALGRDLWIDFVADTGDDRDVSGAVGQMIAPEYRIDDRVLPRGDILLFGGDTAYPVASADEIFLRLVAPWNRAFRAVENEGDPRGRAPDGKPRVILGIPGNHDWYDGLDGFARLFRRERRISRSHAPARPNIVAAPTKPVLEPNQSPRMSILPGAPIEPSPNSDGRSSINGPDSVEAAPPSREASRTDEVLNAVPREVGLVARQLHLDEVGSLARLVRDIGRSVRAFWGGVGVKRRKRLAFRGYAAVQESSYWAFPLAPGLDLWGVDRQLGHLDYGQRKFFARRRHEAPGQKRMFVAPDPAVAFGEVYPPGDGMLRAAGLDFSRHPTLYISGDLHHYERRTIGDSMQVIAGGGGAFLHGTRIRPLPANEAVGTLDCAYPDAAMTRRLVFQVPWKLMAGGAGLFIHLALAAIASIELAAERWGHMALVSGLMTSLLSFAFFSMAGHLRAHPRRIAAASIPFALVLGLMPMLLDLAMPRPLPLLAGDTTVIVVYAILGSFVFGIFLALSCELGLEHQQAFTVLSHPGFKHFVRMCIRTNGHVEAWTIGKDDPLAPGDARLIDSFAWNEPPKPEEA